MERTIEVSNIWERVWTHRRPVAIFVLAGTLVAALVAFLLPHWYLAKGSLLPPGEDQSGFGITRLLRGVSVPGVSLPSQATAADVFQAILESTRINTEIAERFDLKARYKKKYMQDVLKELRSHTKFKLTESGTLDLSVEDVDPKVAADMLNTYIELLDHFNREVRMTKGRRTRQFLEERLDETRKGLKEAEQLLADYQSKNKTVALSPELSSAIETAARLYAQRAALQLRLGLVRGYSRGQTDEEERIKDQLVQLDGQLQSLPEIGLKLARLLREVKTQEQVYTLLTAQHEEARIEEARDVVTVDVLDFGTPPERKYRPKRLVIIALAFLASLAIGCAYALTREDRQRPTAA